VYIFPTRDVSGSKTASTSNRSWGISPIDAVAQQLPELLGRVGAAGEAAADADDRERGHRRATVSAPR
jgi:hypothetical protein